MTALEGDGNKSDLLHVFHFDFHYCYLIMEEIKENIGSRFSRLVFFYFLTIKVNYKETQHQNHRKEMFKSSTWHWGQIRTLQSSLESCMLKIARAEARLSLGNEGQECQEGGKAGTGSKGAHTAWTPDPLPHECGELAWPPYSSDKGRHPLVALSSF